MLYQLLSLADKFHLIKSAHAHCDIPCGIYTPEPALTAARTVVKMVEKIEELTAPDTNDAKALGAYHNAMTRFVHVKEEHAQKCKEELLILWTDYFKPEHLEVFQDLHDKFWKTTKLCSKVKQEVDLQAAKELFESVELIASMFEKAEEAKNM